MTRELTIWRDEAKARAWWEFTLMTQGLIAGFRAWGVQMRAASDAINALGAAFSAVQEPKPRPWWRRLLGTQY